MTMTMGEALIELEKHGSCGDPVWWDNEEYEVRELIGMFPTFGDAEGLRIHYVGHGGPRLGTLSGMVKDRRKLMDSPVPRRMGRASVVNRRCERRHSWRVISETSRSNEVSWCGACGCLKVGRRYRYLGARS